MIGIRSKPLNQTHSTVLFVVNPRQLTCPNHVIHVRVSFTERKTQLVGVKVAFE